MKFGKPNFTENPKHEIRNPKQIQNPNFQNSNTRRLKEISYKDFFQKNKIDEKTKKLFEIFLDASKTANVNNKLILANGGFAVDLAVGKITRNHRDLDMLTFKKDLEWFRKYFVSLGYKIGSYGDPKYSFFFEKDNFHGDFGCIKIEGQKVFDWDGEAWWLWPIKAGDLVWSRKIDKTRVKFVSPALIYDFKKREQRKRDTKRKRELHDFKILEKHYPFLKDYKIK